MTDSELLQAIDKMMDTKIQPIREDIAELREDMSSLQKDMSSLQKDVSSLQKDVSSLQKDVSSLQKAVSGLETKVESLETKVESLEVRVGNLEDKTDNLQSDMQVVKTKVTAIELTLENRTNHNIQLIAENHMSLVDKLNQAIRVSDKTLLYEVQVSNLNYKVENLEKEIADIKQAIA